MVFEEIVEVFDRFFQVATLIKDIFRDLDEATLLVSDDRGTSRNIIDERNFSKGISRVVVYVFLFPPLLTVLALNAVDPFQDDVEVLSFVALPEDDLVRIVVF